MILKEYSVFYASQIRLYSVLCFLQLQQVVAVPIEHRSFAFCEALYTPRHSTFLWDRLAQKPLHEINWTVAAIFARINVRSSGDIHLFQIEKELSHFYQRQRHNPHSLVTYDHNPFSFQGVLDIVSSTCYSS